MSWLNLESSSVLVAIAVLLGLLRLLAAMALFARNYIKVPPSTVAIFYGRKHTLVDDKGNNDRPRGALEPGHRRANRRPRREYAGRRHRGNDRLGAGRSHALAEVLTAVFRLCYFRRRLSDFRLWRSDEAAHGGRPSFVGAQVTWR